VTAKRTESHLISVWPYGANVILKWAFDKYADRRRACLISLSDYRLHQILLEIQIFIHRWLMAGISGSTKKDESDYLSDITTIFCVEQTENTSYSVTE